MLGAAGENKYAQGKYCGYFTNHDFRFIINNSEINYCCLVFIAEPGVLALR
jgi:hypothetical protein